MTDRNTFVWPQGIPLEGPTRWWYALRYGGSEVWDEVKFMFHTTDGEQWALTLYSDKTHFLQLNERDLN